MRLLLLASLLLSPAAYALIPVPDANLRAWIAANYPGAIIGNSVDENHPGVQAETNVYFPGNGIANLQGVQAFVNALTMVADGNPLTASNVYTPPGLLGLSLVGCQLSGNLFMDELVPGSLQSLNVSDNQLTSVTWCSNCGLMSFNAASNLITSLSGAQPPTLATVILSQNQLAGGLAGLQVNYLDISFNSFTSLSELSFTPNGTLKAAGNLLTALTLEMLSPDLVSVDVSDNDITTVGDLYGLGNLDVLLVSGNPLTGGVEELPAGLLELQVANTQLPCLPWLPQTITTLRCTGNSFTCLPNIPPSLNLAPGNFGFTPALCGTANACFIPPPSVRLFAGLQGAWDEAAGLMRDDLRQQGLLPPTEPYTALGYAYVYNNTPLSVPASFFTSTGPNAVVDWVVVEVRQGGMPGTLVQSMPALVRRNGRVIATTGDTLLTLRVARGSYKVAVRHRNHLGVINFASQPFWNGPTTIDILNPGTTQLNMLAVSLTPSGRRLLPMGDVNGDRTVKYVGTSNDRDPILTAVGGSLPTAVLSGQYRREDVNMDGTVKYTGPSNDRDLVLQVVGGSVPTGTRSQVPVF
jgi:hypothetical protein